MLVLHGVSRIGPYWIGCFTTAITIAKIQSECFDFQKLRNSEEIEIKERESREALNAEDQPDCQPLPYYTRRFRRLLLR